MTISEGPRFMELPIVPSLKALTYVSLRAILDAIISFWDCYYLK
ncbi:hypothetical protein SAMN05518856_101538 [Paenibacillus sp. OK003]|nr:hypothetical protein SAMN05518856_101538 [Paenibacillus sp. OK003]